MYQPSDYYRRSEVSNSDLSKLKQELYGDMERDPTLAYNFGRLIDCMITEPEKVNFFNLTCDGEQYTDKDFEVAERMKLFFQKDEMARTILKLADTQKIMINPHQTFDSEVFTLPTRCKWDLWMSSLRWGGDLKSTTAKTQREFEEAVKFFDYDRQRYFYMNMAGSNQDVLIGVSKVNFKVFKVLIKRGDPLWKSGREKCLHLAEKYYLLFGDL